MTYKAPSQGWGKLLMGFVFGCVLTMMIGFTLGGWKTEGAVKYRQDEAVMNAFTSLCVEKFRALPDAEANLKELQKLYSSSEQEALVAKSGAATLPGQNVPDKKLAAACTEQLRKLPKS